MCVCSSSRGVDGPADVAPNRQVITTRRGDSTRATGDLHFRATHGTGQGCKQRALEASRQFEAITDGRDAESRQNKDMSPLPTGWQGSEGSRPRDPAVATAAGGGGQVIEEPSTGAPRRDGSPS